MKFKVILLLAALVLLPALALTGCSKKKSTSTTGTGSTPQPTQAPSTGAQASPTRAPTASTAVPTSPAGFVPTIASGTGATAIEACRLVTKDEATAALGEAVKDPVGLNIGSQDVAPGLSVTISTCNFDSNTGARSVQVTFWRAGGAVSAQNRQIFEQILCAQKERVTGVGDVACWYDSTHTELQVLKGSTFVDIQIQASGPDRTEALKTLVQKALARLQ